MDAPEPRAENQPATTDSQGRVVARFLPRAERARLDAAARSGSLVRVGTVDLLQPAQLPELARASLWLFAIAGLGFLALELAARQAHHAGPLLGAGPLGPRILVLVVVNLVAYVVMIVVHELVHAAVILALGGQPRFGLKLPFAAYCTATGQLFTPSGYTVIALAPLVILTVVGAVVTWLWPDAGVLLWLALVGNVSGAAGDLEAVRQLRRMPDARLIADTATGFVAYGTAA